jgi:glycosyltransferase involved in cell wall biosynthesis
MKIKITVGVITYNRPELLKQAIGSVLRQSYKNFELIISNDYLEVPVTQEALGIENEPRLKIINQVSNLGEIKNMNYLLEIAQGEWFVWLADDDLLHPEFLMIASNAILEGQDKSLVGFFSNYIAASSPDGIFPQPIKPIEYNYIDSPNFINDYTSRKKSLVGCYGMVRVDTLKKIGGMPSLGNSFGPYSDTIVPILLVEQGSLCWTDEPLVFLRTHADSLSCKSADFLAYTSAEEDFLKILSRVCSGDLVNINPDKLIANMIRWFSYNQWEVLHREPSLSKYAVKKIFFMHQLNINLPKLSLQYKIIHIIFLFRFMGIRFSYSVYKKFRSVFKSRPSSCS